MTWFFWTILSVITTALANLFQRVVMRKKDSDPFGTTIIFQFLCGILVALFALSKGFVFPSPGIHFWNLLASAVLWGLSSLYLFKAYQLLESSEIAIITACGAVVTIIASIFFLGETFTLSQFIGTTLIIVSVILINIQKRKTFTLKKGIVYAFIAVVLSGLAVTNDAFILRTYDVVSYTTLGFLLPGVLLLILRPSAIITFKRLSQIEFARPMVLLSLFYTAQAITYYMALTGAGASQVAPIYRANIILTVLLAVLFLKEKDRLFVKFISAILVTTGVLLIK